MGDAHRYLGSITVHAVLWLPALPHLYFVSVIVVCGSSMQTCCHPTLHSSKWCVTNPVSGSSLTGRATSNMCFVFHSVHSMLQLRMFLEQVNASFLSCIFLIVSSFSDTTAHSNWWKMTCGLQRASPQEHSHKEPALALAPHYLLEED